LVPANGRCCLAAGKVTVGLASHWPRITDISGSSLTCSRPGKRRWAPAYGILWSMADFTYSTETNKTLNLNDATRVVEIRSITQIGLRYKVLGHYGHNDLGHSFNSDRISRASRQYLIILCHLCCKVYRNNLCPHEATVLTSNIALGISLLSRRPGVLKRQRYVNLLGNYSES